MPTSEELDILQWLALIGEAPPTETGVSASAHTNIREIEPVGQIVLTMLTWQGPVRDLIVEIARLLQHLVGILIHIGAQVFIPGRNAPLLHRGKEGRPLLDNQRVEGEMLGM